MAPTRRVLLFLRLAAIEGFRPTWQAIVAVLGVTVVSIVTAVASGEATWLGAGLAAVLLIGAFRIWDDADRRAAVAEAKGERVDLLERRMSEMGVELRVSQEQYKVLHDWGKDPGGG